MAAYNPDVIGTSWTPSTPLTPGHSYSWYLGAYTTDGLDAAWNVQSFSLAALATPTTPTVPYGNLPNFSWSSVPGADHYYLYVVDQTTGQLIVNNPNVPGASWTPSAPLTWGDHYAWYVGAYSANGLAAGWTAGPTFLAATTQSLVSAAPGTIENLTIAAISAAS
jgi:hypothetical protein